MPNERDSEQNHGTFLAPDRYLLVRAPSDKMTTLDRTFRLYGEEIHAVVLRQASKQRWNAFLWGGGLRLANTFARREAAEKWLKKLLLHHFPGVQRELADC